MDFKDDEFHDPMLNDAIAIALGIASKEDLDKLRELALKVNEVMSKMFKDIGIILVDFKIEFGKDKDGNIPLICLIRNSSDKERMMRSSMHMKKCSTDS